MAVVYEVITVCGRYGRAVGEKFLRRRSDEEPVATPRRYYSSDLAFQDAKDVSLEAWGEWKKDKGLTTAAQIVRTPYFELVDEELREINNLLKTPKGLQTGESKLQARVTASIKAQAKYRDNKTASKEQAHEWAVQIRRGPPFLGNLLEKISEGGERRAEAILKLDKLCDDGYSMKSFRPDMSVAFHQQHPGKPTAYVPKDTNARDAKRGTYTSSNEEASARESMTRQKTMAREPTGLGSRISTQTPTQSPSIVAASTRELAPSEKPNQDCTPTEDETQLPPTIPESSRLPTAQPEATTTNQSSSPGPVPSDRRGSTGNFGITPSQIPSQVRKAVSTTEGNQAGESFFEAPDEDTSPEGQLVPGIVTRDFADMHSQSPKPTTPAAKLMAARAKLIADRTRGVVSPPQAPVVRK